MFVVPSPDRCEPMVAAAVGDIKAAIPSLLDNPNRLTVLRVGPESSYRIAELSQHQAD
jgi:hypothetical protein